ncbi:Uncharacterised protein [uncultured archaeon]|nr:Uncharacterised protein [uncultured archaeon]
MKKNRYLVDTDVIINYLKGKDISKDFLIYWQQQMKNILRYLLKSKRNFYMRLN